MPKMVKKSYVQVVAREGSIYVHIPKSFAIRKKLSGGDFLQIEEIDNGVLLKEMI